MLIFIVEMMGATTTLLWGLNILLDPVNEPLRQDPDNPGLTIVSFCVLGGGGGGGGGGGACHRPDIALTLTAKRPKAGMQSHIAQVFVHTSADTVPGIFSAATT